eukprot:Nk52_evm14s621 gene=Nk52_evmTU14s621
MGNLCSLESPQQQGGAAPQKHGASAGTISEVLFFPDPGMPCRHGGQCRRKNCDYVHHATSLTRLLQWLAAVKQTLDICVFTITCNEIADAIIACHKRGVRVRIITDDETSEARGSDIESMKRNGIPVRDDNSPTHMHHKYCIIDQRILVNGSFNWTRQAVIGNRENVMITDNPVFVQAFGSEFEKMWQMYVHNT